MLAQAHFEPDSFGVVVNADAIGTSPDLNDFLVWVLNAHSRKEHDAIARFVWGHLDETRDVLALILSNYWHEKRHFSDQMLTNFGAYRTRLAFQIMFAGPYVRDHEEMRGKLVLPITAYADKTRLKLRGLDPPYPAKIVAFAENLAARFRFYDEDIVRRGAVVINSTACYEALAYWSQCAAVEQYFGPETSATIQMEFGSAGLPTVYTWIQHLQRHFGLIRESDKGDFKFINPYLTAPLLFAALNGRAGTTSGNEGGSSGQQLPAFRLAELLDRITKEGWTFHGKDEGEAWEEVDKLCLRLWGKRCVDDMEEDQQRNHEVLGKLTPETEEDSVLARAFSDYIALRERMIQDFRKDPGRFVDPLRFPKDLLPDLHPRPYFRLSRAETSAPPEGWQVVWGGPGPPGSDVPTDWWWSITPAAWETDAGGYALTSDAWVEVTREWSPVAKFLLNGRAATDCLGPELLLAENYLRHSPLDLLFDPNVQWPAKFHHDSTYRMLFGDGEATCDLTGEVLHKDDSLFVHPLTMHAHPRIWQFMLDQDEGSAYWKTMLKMDWSLWLVHKRFEDTFTP